MGTLNKENFFPPPPPHRNFADAEDLALIGGISLRGVHKGEFIRGGTSDFYGEFTLRPVHSASGKFHHLRISRPLFRASLFGARVFFQ